MKTCARWTPDCCGKQDYDGRIVDISTRYWPRGGGFYTCENGRLEASTHVEIKPSAHSAILLRIGPPGDDGYGRSVTLVDREFEAETEAEVKAQVEAWAQQQMDRIVAMLRREFGETVPDLAEAP